MLSKLLEAVRPALVIGMTKEDAMEAQGLAVAIVSSLGAVPSSVVNRAARESLARYMACHLFGARSLLTPICDRCQRDAAVIVFVVLADMMRAPVGGLLERLLVVVGVEPSSARDAVAELDLPEVQ